MTLSDEKRKAKIEYMREYNNRPEVVAKRITQNLK